MIFPYQSYLEASLLVPAGSAIIFLFFAGWAMVGFCKRYCSNKKITAKDIYIFLVCLSMWAVIILDFQTVFRGGIHLLAENEADAISTSGCIAKITEPTKRLPVFRADGEHGADILIGDDVYIAITAKGLDVGDYVVIRYLPRSRFILEIQVAS